MNPLMTRQLVKKYGDRVALKGINLEVKPSECFGILGPNGAGKTTLMKLLYGSLRATSGEVFINGVNAITNEASIKSYLGVMPQFDGLDEDFTVAENLRLYSMYKGLKKNEFQIEDLLRKMRLDDRRDAMIQSLSGGMRRRLAFARALLGSPKVLVLDEPTTGLDPQSRLWIWDLIENLKKQNVAILISTHYMEEAERLCDQVAIVDNGAILCQDSPKHLIEKVIGEEVVEFELSKSEFNYYLGRLEKEGFRTQSINNHIHVYIQNGQNSRQVLDMVTSHKVTIRRPTLNDVFLSKAGHELRDEAQ